MRKNAKLREALIFSVPPPNIDADRMEPRWNTEK
jgi:hypothetical protein